MKLILTIIGVITLGFFIWFGAWATAGFLFLNRPLYAGMALLATLTGTYGMIGAILSINTKQ